MKVCANCGHREYVGALFCSECGSRMEQVVGLTTDSLTIEEHRKATGELDFNKFPTVESAGASITLHVLDFNQFIPLLDSDEFTLGRKSTGQKDEPAIDLTRFEATPNGVSRMHAAIRLEGERVTLQDLGSLNGTRLNGYMIPPHVPSSIHHGDIIALGKLKIQVFFRT